MRQSFTGENPQFQRGINIEVYGEVNELLSAVARDELGHVVQVQSEMPLVEAHSKPLTTERLRSQFNRLGNTPFYLDSFTNHISDNVMLPVSELNRLRRDIVAKLEKLRSQPKRWQLNSNASYKDLLPISSDSSIPSSPHLIVLVRNLKQLQAALLEGIETVYCEFEAPRNCREAVKIVRNYNLNIKAKKYQDINTTIYVAPPRITKPGENYILQQVRSCNADGYIVRNYDQLKFFSADKCIGDFSLNVANPLTADYFKKLELERITASYDLNINQLEDLVKSCPHQWFEVTIHQHIPMFHMEHCVFCAFLSQVSSNSVKCRLTYK